MNTLDRYIAGQLLGAVFLVLLILLMLNTVIAFIGEGGRIGRGNYDYLQAAIFVFCSLPQRAYQMLPPSVLLGGLLSLGTLANNSELVAIRAAGVSVLRLAWSTLQAGLVLLLICLSLGEFLAPAAERFAQSQRSAAMAGVSRSDLNEGVWVRDGSSFVHIGQLASGKKLGQLEIYNFAPDKLTLQRASQAAHAHFQDGRWQLQEVASSVLEDTRIQRQEQATQSWSAAVDPDLLALFVVQPEHLGGAELYDYITYLEANNLKADTYWAAFWSKLAWPVSVLVMVVLCLPFVFGSLRSSGASTRVLVGVMIGMMFFLAQQTLADSGQVFGLNPWLTAWLPTGVMTIITAFALWRMN